MHDPHAPPADTAIAPGHGRWILPLLLPAVAVAWGGWHHGLWTSVPQGYLVFLAGAVSALAVAALSGWMVRRWWGLAAIPTAMAGLVSGAFVLYAGVAEAAGAAVLGLSALAAGSLVDRHGMASPWSRFLAGLAILAAVVGWLLPFPVHGSWGYRIALAALIAWRGRRVAMELRSLASGWATIARAHPAWLSLAVAGGAIASLGLWLPSLNYDDNSTHLILTDQLLYGGYYRLDVSSHLWAVTAWANNALHALAALVEGHESRGALNAWWLVVGMAGAWRLAVALGGSRAIGLGVASLYASQPLAAHFASTMQTDGPVAVVLLHLSADLVNARGRLVSPMVAGAMLGLLLGLKTSSMVYWLLPVGWVAWVALRGHKLASLSVMFATAIALAGSSYAYAALVTGNPLFPFLNDVFRSPFMAPVNFEDVRWHAGVDWRAPWDLTFDTGRFGEALPGAAGVVLLVTLPGIAIEVARRRAGAWIACWMILAGAFMFWQIQYLRYLFAPMSVLAAVGVVGLARCLPARALAALLVSVVAANAVLMPTTSWIAHGNPWGRLARGGPAEKASVEREIVPERALLQRLAAHSPEACVLMTDRQVPFVGGFNGRANVTAWYDPQLFKAREWANEDPSGNRWRQVLRLVGPSHVLLTVAGVGAPLSEALAALGYTRVDMEGRSALWASASPGQGKCDPRFLAARDEARRLIARDGGTYPEPRPSPAAAACLQVCGCREAGEEHGGEVAGEAAAGSPTHYHSGDGSRPRTFSKVLLCGTFR